MPDRHLDRLAKRVIAAIDRAIRATDRTIAVVARSEKRIMRMRSNAQRHKDIMAKLSPARRKIIMARTAELIAEKMDRRKKPR